MVIYVNYFEESIGENVGYLQCSNCLKETDQVSNLEIAGLSTGKFGVPLCENCEGRACRICGYIFEHKDIIKAMKKNGGVCEFCATELGEERVRLSSGTNLATFSIKSQCEEREVLKNGKE